MNDAERRKGVSVRIAGEEHTIRANAEPDYMRTCARYVDERVSDIRSKGGLIETHKATILAALSIADELFQAREELDRLRRDVTARAAALAQRLEEGLGAPQG
jgi:cell division protein ZapA